MMKYFSSIQIGLFILFGYLQTLFCFHWDGNTLYDLESVTAGDIAAEASLWSCSSLVAAPIMTSKCGNDYIVGGYNIMGGSGSTYYGQFYSRTYNNLPPHNQINLSIKIVPVDSWDGATVDDHFSIDIDGTEIYGWRIFAHTNSAASHVCGNTGWPEYPPFTAYLTFPHSSTTSLTLKLINYLNEYSTNESLGFRDIVIKFITASSPVQTLCGVSPAALWDKPCDCPDTHQYPNPVGSGTCSPCDVTCNTCVGPAATQCWTCYNGRYPTGFGQCLLCTSPCSTCSGGATTQCITCRAGYYKVGSQCFPTCDYPLIDTTVGDIVSCNRPCSSGWILWDGSCSPSCASPLVQSTSNTYPLCTFPCASGQALYWNTTCKSTCPFPLATVVANSRTFCNYPCLTTQWLAWNGTCVNSCPIPLYSRVEGSPSRQFCDFLCAPDDYLYWNTSCKSSCPFPYVVRAEGNPLRKFCDYPCQPLQHLAWNGSCLANCPIALLPRLEGTIDARNYCDYPCKDTEYLYWNGSCFDRCEFPLSTRIEGYPMIRKFCDFPCHPSDYLYKNAFCFANCNPPYIDLKYGTPQRMFCNFPCPNNQYWRFTGECVDACPLPQKKSTWNDDKFCTVPCPNANAPYYHQETGTCVRTCLLPAIIDTTTDYPSCSSYFTGSLLEAPLVPNTVTLVNLIKPMQYVRYMDIKMPPRLYRIGVSQARSVISVRTGIFIWDSAKTAYGGEVIAPGVFGDRGVSPSFLVNFWQDFTLVLIALGAAIVFGFLEKYLFKYNFEFWGAAFGRIKMICVFNFLLVVLAYNIDTIILFAGIQFQSIKVGVAPALTAFSMILCLLFLFIAIGLIGYIAYVLRKKMALGIERTRYNQDAIDNFEGQWQWCQIFFTGFNYEKDYNQYFYLIYVLRLAFPMLIVATCYNTPMAVVVIELLVGMAILGFMIYAKPFEKKINYIQMVLFETMVFLMNVCMLILTVRSYLDHEIDRASIVLGDLVILGNVFVNFFVIIFMLIKLYIEAREIYYTLLKVNIEKPFKAATWVQLLAVPLQQAHMWFEELIPNSLPGYPKGKGIIFAIENEARLKAARGIEMIGTHEDLLPTPTAANEKKKVNSSSRMMIRTNRSGEDSVLDDNNPNNSTMAVGPLKIERRRHDESGFFSYKNEDRKKKKMMTMNTGMINPGLNHINNHDQKYDGNMIRISNNSNKNQNPNNYLDISDHNLEMSPALKKNVDKGKQDDSLFDE